MESTIKAEAVDTNTRKAEGPIFQIQRLYVKEQNCKLPNAPGMFKGEWKPEINIEVKAENQALDQTSYQVILTVTVTGKNKHQTAFVAEVQQAGIFTLAGFAESQIKALLGAYCPTVLYPYARKVIADLTLQASLPPVTLAPINFDAAFAEQQTQSVSQQGQTVETTAVAEAVN